MEQNKDFHYSYSAAQRQEIEAIRRKYIPQEENKLERLRRLHRSAGKTAKIWAIVLGVLGTLIFGTGMSLCLSELGDIFGAYAMVIGIAAGIVGLVLVALAYPVYDMVLKARRKKIAPEILRLSEELLQ